MSHYLHNFVLQELFLHHKKRSLSRRLRRIFFFDYIEGTLDTVIRSKFRKENSSHVR